MDTYKGRGRVRIARRFSFAAIVATVLSLVGVTVAYAVGGAPVDVLQKHVVEGVSPAGTTINLFDYWLDARDTPDTKEWEQDHRGEVPNMGINSGVSLKFRYEDSTVDGEANKWTGTSDPRQGIVNKNLYTGYEWFKKGYPALSGKLGTEGNESLSYLFNEYDAGNQPAYGSDYNAGEMNKKFETALNHKKAFMDTQGLLQVDENGFFYYDSTKNFASFDEGANAFTLYDTQAVCEDENGEVTGQFFPFNTGDEVFTGESDDGKLVADSSLNSRTSEKLNHYFGLSMETSFVQVNGGHTADGTPVAYEFSGDDDVWVFIDDVLVGDLGGIHNKTSLKIDFTTGDVFINGAKSTTIKDCFDAAGKSWNSASNTFADNTNHTLKFYYLERGNSASNMSLKFNFVTAAGSEIVKLDQNNNPVVGAKFALYPADEKYQVTSEPFCTGRTNESGVMLFEQGGDPVSLDELLEKSRYYVLEETEAPDGYRAGSTKSNLYFYDQDEQFVLLSDNWTETGTYAASKLTATAPTSLKSADGDEIDYSSGGTLFAVPLQRVGSGDIEDTASWRPVWGNPTDGWQVGEVNDRGSIIKAAQVIAEQNQSENVFVLGTTGGRQATVSDLPGDIKTYYFMMDEGERDKAQYTVGFFYTTADSIEGATADNTRRVDDSEFDRSFSTQVYVSDIKNRLVVQKLDAAGSLVDGATFSLYNADEVTLSEDGSVDTSSATPVDTGVTGAVEAVADVGTLVFPSDGKLLSKGTYYLVEDEAPEGYIRNAKATKVIVDDSGVYADAGTADDGIYVERGVGSVTRSMVQFAADDQVDATLHDIQAELVTSSTYPEDVSWTSTGKATHLHYADGEPGVIGDYVPATDVGDYPATLGTDTGWSQLVIEQCLNHEGGTSTQVKQDIEGEDLVNLFSGVVTVQVTNERAQTTASVEAEKELTGRELKANEFSFELRDAEGNVLQTVKNNGEGAIAFEPLTYSYFEQGEHAYTIAEVAGNAEGITYDKTVYNVTVNVTTGDDGALAAEVTYEGIEGDEVPVFENTYTPDEKVPPTGGEEEPPSSEKLPQTGDYTPFIAAGIACVAVALVAAGVVVRRRS